MLNRIKRSGRENNVAKLFQAKQEEKKMHYFGEDRKTIVDIIAPNGGNVVPMPYMTIQDAGVDIYYVGLYIDKLPKGANMASTFVPLFNAEGVTSSVHINPLLGESISRVNKRIDNLDAESYEAEKHEEINRLRTISGKLHDAVAWAKELDSGENTLYECSFLFLVQADSLDKLQLKVSDLQGEAKKKTIELAACYGSHPEAFLSSTPLNKIFKVSYDEAGLISKTPIKKHILDKKYLATIFNHTTSEFFHNSGVVFARNIYSGMPTTFDPFDISHFSYGMVVAGMSGYGKSATIKMLDSRLVDFGVHIANIDYEPLPGDGKRGEYSVIAEMVGGVNYLISQDSDCKLNFFEISDEFDYDCRTGEEYPALHLNDKITDMVNILLAIATSSVLNGRVAAFSAETYSRMSTIITRVVKNIYDNVGLIDGDASSLYETNSMTVGSFKAGRRKKKLPQIHDFYIELLRQNDSNKDRFKEDAFHLLLDIYEDRVKELYYCPYCLKEFTKEEYESLREEKNGKRWCDNHEDDKTIPINVIKGTKSYLDTQSSVELDINVPYHNFDLSQIPESDRPVMVMVCQNFIEENFIKKNSANPKEAKKLIVSTDEAHKFLPYEEARRFENSLYRTARKRHVAPRLLMQSIADLARYPDAEEIIKSTETFFLFRHNYRDRDFIKTTTDLTDSQVKTILNLGGTAENKRCGELCLIDMPTKQSIFLQADYLKESEFYLVETDVENIVKAAQKKG